MSTTHYPRILIVGQSFNRHSGGGITLINLFQGWPVENLAVASTNIDLTQNKICTNYYQIGNEEERWAFPFNYLQRKLASGRVQVSQETGENPNLALGFNSRPKSSGFKERLKKTVVDGLHFLGIYYTVYEYRLSEKFLNWVAEFKPDIIYAQATSLPMIRFTQSLIDKTGLPVVIHIMDDYISTINQPGLLYKYWARVIDSGFRGLINGNSLLMSICQEMSDEYSDRYGKRFIPFHNPVDIADWQAFARTNWDTQEVFTVLYAGRIGIGTEQSILQVAAAVDRISRKGKAVRFWVQSTTTDAEVLAKLASFQNCEVVPPVAYKDLPQRLSSVDLLVLPIDFDKDGLKYIRLSMPTKVSEYMATGTPILVYAPEETALSAYAIRMKWAKVVNEADSLQLAHAIASLAESQPEREALGTRAKEIARLYHNAPEIRENFRSVLAGFVATKLEQKVTV